MQLESMQELVARRRTEASEAERGTAQAEHWCAEARAAKSVIADQAILAAAALHAAREDAHRAAHCHVAQTCEKLAAERANVAVAAEELVCQTNHNTVMQGLRVALEEERKAAAEAQASVEHQAALRDDAAALPALLERRRQVQASAARVAKAHAQMRRDVDSEREKLDAVVAGHTAKTEALTARIADLEQKCRDLQPGARGTDSEPPDSVRVAPPPAVRAALEIELKAAQENNRYLVLEVRRARAARDSVNTEHEELRQHVESAKVWCENDAVERQALEAQLCELVSREQDARGEVERLRAEIRNREEQASTEEEAANAAREKHRCLDGKRQALVRARQQAKETATVLEWRLQKTVAQLDKEKPGAALVRCLNSSRVPGPPRASVGAAFTSPRGKRSSCLAAAAGNSDADADSTTAGGETEGLP